MLRQCTSLCTFPLAINLSIFPIILSIVHVRFPELRINVAEPKRQLLTSALVLQLMKTLDKAGRTSICGRAISKVNVNYYHRCQNLYIYKEPSFYIQHLS
jgi:hypothetical protein